MSEITLRRYVVIELTSREYEWYLEQHVMATSWKKLTSGTCLTYEACDRARDAWYAFTESAV